MDYPETEGTEIYASGTGLVVVSEECTIQPTCVLVDEDPRKKTPAANGGYGNVNIIEYGYDSLPIEVISAYNLQPGQSLYVLTAHMVEPSALQVGAIVNVDTVIGGIGSTGNSSGNHLHVEIRMGDSGLLWANQGQGYDAWRGTWFDTRHLTPVDPELVWD